MRACVRLRRLLQRKPSLSPIKSTHIRPYVAFFSVTSLRQHIHIYLGRVFSLRTTTGVMARSGAIL